MERVDMTTKLNLDQIWNTVLDLARSNNDFDEIFFESFLQDTKLLEFNDDLAYILIEGEISRATLERNIKVLEDYLQKSSESNFKIKLVTDEEYSSDSTKIIPEVTTEAGYVFNSNLLDQFTFSNFVVGNSNKESYQASVAVASNPGNLFNPLFIYGNSGIGKTHLVHSIGNEIKKQKPNMRILYVSANTFMNDYLDLAQGKKNNEWFDQKYLDIDVLIVDDIQSIKNAQKTNEMFFNVYNNLFSKNKQIVITSDVLPKELNGLENRLVSRFSQGLSVSIAPPEFSTSIQILKNKIDASTTDDEEKLVVGDEALEFIATHFSADVRELEGAINTLLLFAIITNTDTIDLADVQEAFKDNQISKSNDNLTPEKIQKIVTSYYNITQTQIRSANRQKRISLPRHIAIYLTRSILDTPYEKIGKLYGGRDHSTIMTSYHKIRKKIEDNDKEYLTAIDEITKLLKS